MRHIPFVHNKRRTTTHNELIQSLNHSLSITLLSKRQNGISLFANEHDKSFVHRKQNNFNIKSMDSTTVNKRNLLFANSNSSSRRSSFQQQDVIQLSKYPTNIRNFYIFFLILFCFLFISIIYSFIRMIKNFH